MPKFYHDCMAPFQLDGNISLTHEEPMSPTLDLPHSTPTHANQALAISDILPVPVPHTPPRMVPATVQTAVNESVPLPALDISPIVVPATLPTVDDQPLSDSLLVVPLLSSLTSTPSSASLKSWSDLDNFLPFSVTGDHEVSDGQDTPNPPHPPDQARTPDHSSPQTLSLGDSIPRPIPVLIGQAPPYPPQQNSNRRSPCRTTIRRNNRAVTALSLPNVMVTNHRSIFPKFNNLVDEILELDMHLGLHCEIWENKENIAHANKIEEALEIHGIQYISTPRPNRRGGGAAITLIRDSPFVLTQLDPSCMSVDDSLEVCWGLLKPKQPTGPIKSIIVCSFYIPPYSKKKSALIEHISLNYFILKSQHPDAAFLCGGDKNDLNIQLLLDINPTFRQIVTQPTYRLSVLDVLVTDIGHYYLEPIIRPAVQPDNPTTAKPSDHSIAFAKSNTNANQPAVRETVSRIIRPLNNETIRSFASWIQRESWEFVYNGIDSSDMVDRLNFLIQFNLDAHCPTKTVKMSNLDGRISSAAVKQASRRKNREYTKHGNSEKYKELKREVKTKLKDAAKTFLEEEKITERSV